jgi:hypothetical protein
MSDPRYGDRRDWEYGQWNVGDDSPGWALGGVIAIVLLIGVAMWGASHNTTQVASTDDATTGQSMRPQPMPPMSPSP